MALAVHNTPFGDIVDTEDDLQPLVFAMFKDAVRMVGLVAAAMSTAQFDRARLAELAGKGWITVTELADTLARDHGVPFRRSHEIATRLVADSAKQPARPLHEILRDASTEILGRPIEYSAEALSEVLSAQHFVAVRTTPGGPAPSETARAATVSAKRLVADKAWLEETAAKLRAADDRLNAAAARL